MMDMIIVKRSLHYILLKRSKRIAGNIVDREKTQDALSQVILQQFILS